ncbi:MAG: transposase [Syntrophobacteraceae bacterium]|jgi:REP element-mobilizing transposase RayT|nr:transposase [Syntrophobacteraceae bacterium]
MPRRERLDAPGTLHHVIVRGIERRRIVDDDEDRGFFVQRLGELSEVMAAPVYAWALMINHAHVLLRSGPEGLASFMRKLLTGYAVRYNRRHHRHGHLFQNRYKSIVVEEDTYFRALVRYIHLNPVRAGTVDSLSRLDAYPWSGHSALAGGVEYSWQDTSFVLRWFGDRVHQARAAYRQFVEKGIPLGAQPHLVGGGLVRSAGGWSEVRALRRLGSNEAADERILGSGPFVTQILDEADSFKKYRLTNLDRERMAEELITSCCEAGGISVEALRGGSRRQPVSRTRRELALNLTDRLGLSYAEAARLLGISTSAVAKIISRVNENKSN